MKPLDDLDIKIATFLGNNVRASNREIARQLGIAQTTVRDRLKNLFESRKLKISALFDIEKIPEMPAIDLAIIGIKQTGPPDYTIQKLSRIPSVLFVASVTGSYDIVVGVATNSRKMLLHIIANEIESIDSVFDSETFVVLYNTGLYVPAETMNYLKRYDEISKNPQATFPDADTDNKQ
ncbi:Lrp/AsnC family transcriptional regulator [bacterium]|nr:Lrp/AsnC family transcriptional regulator [bacterium]